MSLETFTARMMEMTAEKSPPSWLNEDFMQRALRNGENDSTITVTTCEVNARASACPIGSVMYGVTATLENGEKRSFIVKCRAQDGIGAEFAELFDKELKLMTETLPAIESLLKNSSPEEFQPLGPKCYYHGSEPSPFLVLEDLTETGFTYGMRRYGLDFHACSMVLKTLARFHAATIAFVQQNPEAMEEYSKHDLWQFRGVVDDYLKNSVGYLADEVKNWEAFEEFSEKLLRLRESVCDRYAETIRQKDGPLNCLVNADVFASSLRFKVSENMITDVRFSELPAVSYASPVIDLLNYLYGCGSFRIQLWGMDSLIKDYHSTLQKTLHLLGYSDLAPPLEDFLELVSQFDFYAFSLSLTVLPFVFYDPNEEAEAANVENASSVQIIASRPYKGKFYKFLMQNHLLVFDSKGIFQIGGI